MSEDMLQALKTMLTDALGPVMARLEEVEKLAAEGRDDERKVEGEGEMAEPVTVIVEDEKVGEVMDAIEDAVEGEEPAEMGAGYTRLMEENAELKKALEALKGESAMAEKAVAELKAHIAHREAEAAVTADLQGKPHLSQMSERLVGLYHSDRDLYNDIVSLKPSTRSQLADRQTTGYTPAPKGDVYDRALKIQNERGISFADALASLQ